MINIKPSYRFIPLALSAEEAARRGLGAGSGWDKVIGDGMSFYCPRHIIITQTIL